ncbi:MAG: prepilin-type N-terminal cleavage/methylation domain-containing protein [Thermoleophilia bacterium]
MKMRAFRESLSSRDGFTLIELLVVIIIIAILAAIAIPVYLTQRQKAWDANSKSDLNTAAVAQATYNADFGVYTGDEADLKARGYNRSANITLSIPTSGATFCMETFHSGDPSRVWFVDSGSGSPNPTLGNCP